MATDPKQIVTQLGGIWKKLTPRRRVLLAGGAILAIAGTAWMTTRSSEGPYATLYSNLAAEDAGAVLADLKENHIPYKLEGKGSTVLVPEARVHELRLELAQRGLPRGGGVGFEIFEKQSFGTTSFVEQLNYRRALQGELQRTISSIEAVAAARVHLAMRERTLFRADDEPPSASVLVTLRPGRSLPPGDVMGIVHLVASSVEGLTPERVTVVDERGRVLTGDGDSSGKDAQRELEATLSQRVREMVERMVGPGHAEVAVTAEMDHAHLERTSETFDKEGVLRSEALTEERAADSASGGAGVAGVRGNLPGVGDPAAAPTGGGGGFDASLLKRQQTRNFEVSRVVEKTTTPKVRIKQLHVAVLVDALEGGKPRSREDLAQVAALARQAAGLDERRGDKIEVASAPFAVVPGEGAADPGATAAPGRFSLPKGPALVAAAAGAALLLFAVVAIFLRRSSRARRGELVPARLPMKLRELEAAMPSPEGAADALALAQPSARDRALQAARADSVRAARVLSAWLAESEGGAS